MEKGLLATAILFVGLNVSPYLSGKKSKTIINKYKTMKKFRLFFVAIMMASTQIFAVDADIVLNSIGYKINTEDNTATVVSFDNTSGITQITIPEKVEYNSTDYPVTTIGERAFSRSSLKIVTIGNSVTTIGAYAFQTNQSLTDIYFGNSVITIGVGAFYNCSSIKNIVIPTPVTTIGERAFTLCNSMVHLTIGSSVESIGDHAFYNCTSLVTVTFEGNLCQKNINAMAFECDKTTTTAPTLVFPNSWDNMYLPMNSITPWNGRKFNSNRYFSIDAYKIDAKAEIEAEEAKVSNWSEIETTIINDYKKLIMSVDGEDVRKNVENKNIIDNAQSAALKYIALHGDRPTALADIETAMQGETSAYLTGLVQQYIDIINSATDVTAINNAKNTAVGVLNAAMAAYKACKSEALGTLGTKQDGPAVEVIKDGKSIILYGPDKVNFIKVSTEE